MADISMCLNSECPLKNTCYRFQAKPSEFWQSYSDFTFSLVDGVANCEYFWGMNEQD